MSGRKELRASISNILVLNLFKDYLDIIKNFPQLDYINHIQLFNKDRNIKNLQGYYLLHQQPYFKNYMLENYVDLALPNYDNDDIKYEGVKMRAFVVDKNDDVVNYSKNEILFKVLRLTRFLANPVSKNDDHLRNSEYYLDYENQLLFYDDKLEDKEMVACLLKAYIDYYLKLNEAIIVDRGDEYAKARKNAMYYIISNYFNYPVFNSSFIYMASWDDFMSDDFLFDFFRELSFFTEQIIFNLLSISNNDEGKIFKRTYFNMFETYLINHYLNSKEKDEFLNSLNSIEEENFFRDIALDIKALKRKVMFLSDAEFLMLCDDKNSRKITVFPQYYLGL